MASNRDNYNAQQNLKRNFQDNVEVSEKTRLGMETAMTALTLAGRVNDATTVMQMISKTQQQTNMDKMFDVMDRLINRLDHGGKTEVIEE